MARYNDQGYGEGGFIESAAPSRVPTPRQPPPKFAVGIQVLYHGRVPATVLECGAEYVDLGFTDGDTLTAMLDEVKL